MKVLMISGDKKALDPSSDVSKRIEGQRSVVSRLDAFVWPQHHSWRDIARTLKKIRHEVVTAQDPFWRGLLGWLLARRHGAKLQLQVHADLRGQSRIRRALSRFLLRRADSVRAVSASVATQVKATGTHARVEVLPIYVDLERFRSVTRVPHDREIILWVGRFEDEKDPLLAIEVLKHVRADGHDAALIMLGAGKLEDKLRGAAHGLPVEFPGWKAPEDYLAIADVVLSTSRHESWGASIIEALAAGVPVVAPDVGVAREAGAIVTERSLLAKVVLDTLCEKPDGKLQLTFLNKEEWQKRWRETLV